MQQGQVIGSIGNVKGLYKAHLHFEMRKESIFHLPSSYWPSANGKNLDWIEKHYYEPSVFIKKVAIKIY